MTPQTALIKTTPQSLQKIGAALAITEKLLHDDNPLGLPDLIPYRKGNKWGFCNRKKEIVIECVYDEVKLFKEGLATVRKSEKWGFIDKKGNLITLIIYNNVRCFSEGRAAVQRYPQWGFIDKTGFEIIPIIYESVGDFHNGLAWINVKRGFRYECYIGFINIKGEIIIPSIYNSSINFKAKIGAINKDDVYILLDINGVEIISLEEKYHYIFEFSEGLAGVIKEDKYGYKYGFINESGEEIIKCIYDALIPVHFIFSENLARLRKEGKWGYIDKLGNTIIPFIYDHAKDYSEGLAAVNLNGKWGYIDKLGNIIPFIYDHAEDYSEGLAAVSLNGKWGYIDKLGNIAFKFDYSSCGQFSEGVTICEKVDDDGYHSPFHYECILNKEKNELIFLYDGGAYSDFSNGLSYFSGYGTGLRDFYIDKNGTKYYEE